MNRTFGVNVFKYVASGKCKTDGHLDSGVAQRKCYKAAVKKSGAKGFTDTLGRMGISLFGNLNPNHLPPYLGYPAMKHPAGKNGIATEYDLPKVDWTQMERNLANSVGSALKGMAQSYKRLTVSGNSATQSDIKIPAGHILFISVRDESR